MTLSQKNKKKIVTFAIVAGIFLALIVAVVLALAFIRESLGKAVGELEGEGSAAVHFDLQKVKELGIVAE